MTAMRTPETMRVRPQLWIGLVAVTVYVLLAAGVANLLTDWLAPSDPAADYALGHFPVLIPLVVAGVVFVRWAGWGPGVWRTPASFETRPRRWWLLAIPALLLAQNVVLLAASPAANWQVGTVVLIAAATALVGIGEELYFRGILRASVRAHHGETMALLVTALAFGAAHSVASLGHGLPLGFIAFQVAVTALGGAVYYGAFLATGRLWVAMVLHALDDFSLAVSSGNLTGPSGQNAAAGPVNSAIQFILWVLAGAVLVSCIRQDRRDRQPRPVTDTPAAD